MRSSVVLLASLLLFSACSSTSPRTVPPPPPLPAADSSGSGASFLHTVILYVPNRVLDLFDMVRFGVSAGPGVGGQVKATSLLQATALTRFSAGAGLQTLRHLPVQVSTENAVGLGPIELGPDVGITWYETPYDLRVLAHVVLVGGHVAVNPWEILDFAAGLVTLDPAGDDY